MLNPELEKQLEAKLESRGLEYSSVVDYRNRCSYYFASLLKMGESAAVKIENCEEEVLGQKDLGRSFLMGSEEEKAILLTFAIVDIIEQPLSPSDQEEISEILPEKEATEVLPDSLTQNEHTTRYFFSPSAYNLKEGEFYYNSLYFFLHDIQYGISDNFSIGMGTTLIGIPFYLTPKLSFPLGEKSTLGIGDMIILGTWGSDFFGNLLYGVYTHGTTENNLSLGSGLFSTNTNEITREYNSLVFNLSGLAKISGYVYLVTENYGFRLNTTQNAYYDEYNPSTDELIYFDETFSQKLTIIYGLSGLRFVRKSNDYSSWQFGLTYLLTFFEDVPSKYKQANWYTSSVDGGSRLIAFPTISYTIKFGRMY
jgi:hypothetical protein